MCRSAWARCSARSDAPKRPRAAFSEAIRLQPENADAHYNFGIALAQAGKLPDAAREFRATVDLRPADVEARFNLGIALAQIGTDATRPSPNSPKPLRIKPDLIEARQALADLTARPAK